MLLSFALLYCMAEIQILVNKLNTINITKSFKIDSSSKYPKRPERSERSAKRGKVPPTLVSDVK